MEGLSTASIVSLLESALNLGYRRIGQIALRPDFSLCHADDVESVVLKVHHNQADAIELARYDDEGQYRPLKTAPNFRHGWLLKLDSVADVRVALDFIYPAAIGTWLAALRGDLEPTALRKTLGRQTGMYRVAGRISDAEAEDIVGTLCRPGCLRHILWEIPAREDIPPVYLPPEKPGEIPLLCAEACNLYVAEARSVAKR